MSYQTLSLTIARIVPTHKRNGQYGHCAHQEVSATLNPGRTRLVGLGMNAKRALFILLLFPLGCAPGDIAMDGGEDSGTDTGSDGTTGDGDPTFEGFAEIRCVTISDGFDACFGRLTGVEDAWSPVMQDCDLQTLVTMGQMTQADGWGASTCAPGSHPTVLPKWQCFADPNGTTWCFSGDGQWWIPVTPSCDVGGLEVEPWPTWICGSSAPLGAHVWDSVSCSSEGPEACGGFSGLDSMPVWPTCYLDQFAKAEIPACLGEPGEMWSPCPIDQASGQPTLCFGEDLACVPADFGEANICLPLGSCPDISSEFDVLLELGWGDACYPRCQSDADCADGMICGMAVADGFPMCAWPLEG